MRPSERRLDAMAHELDDLERDAERRPWWSPVRWVMHVQAYLLRGRCLRLAAVVDKLAAERDGVIKAVDDYLAHQGYHPCGDRHGGLFCVKAAGHRGEHELRGGTRWDTP